MDSDNNRGTTGGEAARYVVLVTDMLNDFVYGELKSKRAKAIIPKVKLLLDKARSSAVPVIYSNDQHIPTDPELKVWGEHAMKGTIGSTIVDDLRPSLADRIVSKRAYSAFDDGRLDRILNKLYNGRGITTIIITGIHTHICIKHSAYDAFMRGYETIIARDAVNAFTRKDHLLGLNYMKDNYGSKIQNVATIIRKFSELSTSKAMNTNQTIT